MDALTATKLLDLIEAYGETCADQVRTTHKRHATTADVLKAVDRSDKAMREIRNLINRQTDPRLF